MNLVEREIYSKKITPFINKNIIKVIVGQRRVGKSCFLQWLSQKYKIDFPDNPVVYVNMEDINFEHLNNVSRAFITKQLAKCFLVIFDAMRFD